MTHAERCNAICDKPESSGPLLTFARRGKRPEVATCSRCGAQFKPWRSTQKECSRRCQDKARFPKVARIDLELQAMVSDKRLEPFQRELARISTIVRDAAKAKYGSLSEASRAYGRRDKFVSAATVPDRGNERSQERNVRALAEWLGVEL